MFLKNKLHVTYTSCSIGISHPIEFTLHFLNEVDRFSHDVKKHYVTPDGPENKLLYRRCSFLGNWPVGLKWIPAWNTCRQWRHFLIPVRHWYTGQARHTAMVHIRVLWSWCIKASKPTNVAHRNSCHGKRFTLMAESEWMLKWSTF